MEVPDPVTLGGVKLQIRPLGETELARATIPAKPLMLVRVIVDVPELPTWIVRDDGSAVTWKLGVGGWTGCQFGSLSEKALLVSLVTPVPSGLIAYNS